MPRLPVPGADSGQWGQLLNEFLLEAHSSSGTLKNGSVQAAQIADNTIPEAKLQISNSPSNGQVLGYSSGSMVWTTPTQQSSTDSLGSLLIFYAPPSIINAVYDLDYAAGILSRYDHVVLGTGLEDPGSPYFADTSTIISKVAALSPSTTIWGYIDSGVTTGNLSLSTINTQVDQWLAIGAGGIFLDVFGYAYGVSRSRQNSILDYIHSQNVGAILNVFDADEALGSQVDATYNPTGVATHANDTDVLLLESWVYNSDAYSAPHYTTFSDIKTRGDKARAYRDSIGIKLFAVNILDHTASNENTFSDYRGIGEALARIWRLDAQGIAASGYAASGGDVGKVRPRKALLAATPYRPDAPYTLNGPWTQVQAADLGITVDYDTGTHAWEEL